MINTHWGWGHSHKGVVERARLLLLTCYRELGWSSHKEDLIQTKPDEKEYKGLLCEVLWHYEDINQEKSQRYKEVDKLYNYMKKHRGSRY